MTEPHDVRITPKHDVRITLNDDLIVDYCLDTGLVIDGRRYSVTCKLDEAKPIRDDQRPIIVLGTRAILVEANKVHFNLPLGEPDFRRVPGTTIVCRRLRKIILEGDLQLFWSILSLVDGQRTVINIVTEVRESLRTEARVLLEQLISAGVIDVAGRPIGRFVHAATKKGVFPGGGLAVEEVLRLVTDEDYRSFPDADKVPLLCTSVLDSVAPLNAILRARRSYREYEGTPIQRVEFDNLLETACGITGAIEWAGRSVKLRAYPSSGGLYAVEVYPVVFAVDELQAGVYHYQAKERVLEIVRPKIDQRSFVDAALPEEREMLSGVATMICLVAEFPRHERKYGEGGYRMLVAEAGHISENLILVATAMGLAARPFGGVFDELLNRELGFDGDEEQFLLSVIVGHAGYAKTMAL
jgi:SagB-type dehydrogenase family enzyme